MRTALVIVGGWSASGTLWIGDYTIVEEASLTANGNTLTGSGLVSMITLTDGSQRTLLFRDGFEVNTGNGTLTPQAVSGYEFRLNELVGFSIEQDYYDLAIDVNTTAPPTRPPI
jgi:hypothetical protein